MKNKTKTLKIVLLSITILLCGGYALAQTFVNIGIDPKMAIQGPGYNYEQKHTLDIEATIGFHLGNYRVSQSHKFHKAIDFSKHTWVAVDYMLEDKIAFFNVKNFRSYAGVEFLSLYRSNVRKHYGYDDTVRDYNNVIARFGARVELLYIPKNSYLGVYLKYSGYQGEEVNNGEFNKYRHEGVIGLSIYFD